MIDLIYNLAIDPLVALQLAAAASQIYSNLSSNYQKKEEDERRKKEWEETQKAIMQRRANEQFQAEQAEKRQAQFEGQFGGGVTPYGQRPISTFEEPESLLKPALIDDQNFYSRRPIAGSQQQNDILLTFNPYFNQAEIPSTPTIGINSPYQLTTTPITEPPLSGNIPPGMEGVPEAPKLIEQTPSPEVPGGVGGTPPPAGPNYTNIAAGISAAIGLGQTLYGIYGAATAERPKYETSPALGQLVTSAEERAKRGLTPESKLMGEQAIASQSALAEKQLRESTGGNLATYISNLPAIQAQAQAGKLRLAAQDEAARQANIQNLERVRQIQMQEAQIKYQAESQQAQRDIDAANKFMGAGLLNITSATDRFLAEKYKEKRMEEAKKAFVNDPEGWKKYLANMNLYSNPYYSKYDRLLGE